MTKMQPTVVKVNNISRGETSHFMIQGKIDSTFQRKALNANSSLCVFHFGNVSYCVSGRNKNISAYFIKAQILR